MKHPSEARPPSGKIPAFYAVPIRARCDGWTPIKQAEFIGMLAQTRSVAEAARFVGMARETAYRLRRKPGAEGFAEAWDVALGRKLHRAPRPYIAPEARDGSHKVTDRPDWNRAIGGQFQPVMRRGKYVGTVHKRESSELLRYLSQVDRAFRDEQKAVRRRLKSQSKKRGSV